MLDPSERRIDEAMMMLGELFYDLRVAETEFEHAKQHVERLSAACQSLLDEKQAQQEELVMLREMTRIPEPAPKRMKVTAKKRRRGSDH